MQASYGDYRLPPRFWRHVVEQSDGCWNWTATRSASGYGRVQMDGRLAYAHRVAYEALVDVIPLGMSLDHLCRTRYCVNPSHLEVVTTAENNLRGLGWSGRNARKTHCPQGHPYGRVSADGRRRCRICIRERSVQRYRAMKAPERRMT